jgi:hypothetical protein
MELAKRMHHGAERAAWGRRALLPPDCGTTAVYPCRPAQPLPPGAEAEASEGPSRSGTKRAGGSYQEEKETTQEAAEMPRLSSPIVAALVSRLHSTLTRKKYAAPQ